MSSILILNIGETYISVVKQYQHTLYTDIRKDVFGFCFLMHFSFFGTVSIYKNIY